MTGVSPDAFRDLLGRFTTGVTVLTARTRDGRPCGMTANAVSAVSLAPPLVLVCVDRTHDIHDVLRASRHFALNVLAADQEAISRRFAEDDGDRFFGVAVRGGPHGLPLLADVVAWVVCEKHAAVPAGDHTIFIGLVTGGEPSEHPPLTYFRGAYGGLVQNSLPVPLPVADEGTSPPGPLPLAGEGERGGRSVTGDDRADS